MKIVKRSTERTLDGKRFLYVFECPCCAKEVTIRKDKGIKSKMCRSCFENGGINRRLSSLNLDRPINSLASRVAKFNKGVSFDELVQEGHATVQSLTDTVDFEKSDGEIVSFLKIHIKSAMQNYAAKVSGPVAVPKKELLAGLGSTKVSLDVIMDLPDTTDCDPLTILLQKEKLIMRDKLLEDFIASEISSDVERFIFDNLIVNDSMSAENCAEELGRSLSGVYLIRSRLVDALLKFTKVWENDHGYSFSETVDSNWLLAEGCKRTKPRGNN